VVDSSFMFWHFQNSEFRIQNSESANMKPLNRPASLSAQVYKAVADEIVSGSLEAGMHLRQEEVAARLGVSRQPVQQAMVMLSLDGLVTKRDKRGLYVAPFDPELMQKHYDIRSALDGLAARQAAQKLSVDTFLVSRTEKLGDDILAKGRAAISQSNIVAQITFDEAFHHLIYDVADNPLFATSARIHWQYLRRAMGEVLRHVESPQNIWQQHEAILAAVVAGNSATAEKLALDHANSASKRLFEAYKDIGLPNEKVVGKR
jgi:DNA-binding GntR family transcriptional regulator